MNQNYRAVSDKGDRKAMQCSRDDFDKFLADNPDFQEVVKYPPLAVTNTDVNEERDRRSNSGVPFMGKVFEFDQRGKDNITGAATLANLAMIKNVDPKDTRWHVAPNAGELAEDYAARKEKSPEFTWITADNSMIVLNAENMALLGQVAANWETMHIFAARALKDANPIPLDYTDDKYWP